MSTAPTPASTSGDGAHHAPTGRCAIARVEEAVGEGFVAGETDRVDASTPRAANAFGRLPAVSGTREGLALVAGLSFTGLRTAAFARGSDRDALNAHLSASAVRHLPHVVHLACETHDDHEVTSGSGAFQLLSATHQEAVDFTLIAHRIAELSLTPGIHALDRAEVADAAGDVELPDAEALRAYLGDPDDDIATPTPAQRLLFGAERRRLPNWFSFDHPTLNGADTSGPASAAATFARHTFFDEHLPALAQRAMDEFAEKVGRRYAPVSGYRTEDAHFVLVATGAAAARAERIVDHLRETTRARVGCVKLNVIRPFPRTHVAGMIEGKKGVTVLERLETPLADEGPLEREVRAALDSVAAGKRPSLHVGRYGLGGVPPTDGELLAAVRNMTARGGGKRRFCLGVTFPDADTANPKQQAFIHEVRRDYLDVESRLLPAEDIRLSDPEEETALDLSDQIAPDVEPPMAVRRYRDGGPPLSRVSRFWSQAEGTIAGAETATTGPFEAAAVLPPASATFFDATETRTHLPQFIGSACTGCGLCFTHCAHAAIPPVVIGIESLLRAGADVAGERGVTITDFTPHFKALAQYAARALKDSDADTVGGFLPAAFEQLVEKKKLDGERLAALRSEFHAILDALREFPVAVTERFFTLPESRSKGSGELFSVAVNPQACTGCNACVDVCPEEALVALPQTDDGVKRARDGFRLWEALPDTPGDTIRRVREDPEFGPVAAALLSRNFSTTLVGGDGADPGSGERNVMHWVVSIIESLMQPEALAFAGEVDELVARLSKELHGVLDAGLPVDDLDALSAALAVGESARLDKLLDRVGPGKVLDRTRLARLVDILKSLRDLRWALTEGPSGAGRARLGLTLAPGSSVPWGREHPRNPFCFPVTVHWDPTTPDFATGLCLGHLRHCLDNLRVVRRARLEADGRYDPRVHDAEIAALGWRDLTDDEWKTVQPVLLVADARTLVADGLHRLAALLAGEAPVKVILLDERGSLSGSASGIVSPALAMMSRNAFVLQASTADPGHLAEGLVDGLRRRRPALFHLHVPRHAVLRSPTALESRAFPCLRFDPDEPGAFGLRLSLEGNPEYEAGWVLRTLRHVPSGDGSEEATLTVPITYADWAATEPRFREHFSPLAPDTKGATPLHEVIALDSTARSDRVPFIHVVDENARLGRLRVSSTMVRRTEEALAAWTVLQEIAGVVTPFTGPLRERLKTETETEHAAAIASLKAEYEERLAGLEAEHSRRTAEVIRNRLLDLAGYGANATEDPPRTNGGGGGS